MSFNFNFRRLRNVRFGAKAFTPPILTFGTVIPSQITANMTLSNGNKTVTHAVNVSTDAAFGTVPNKAGKKYFEALIGGAGNTGLPYSPGVGFTSNFTNANSGPSQPTLWIYGSDGGMEHAGVDNPTGGATLPGTAVLGWAVDFDTGKAWVSVAGVYQFAGNPVTEVNPTFSFPANTQLWPAVEMNSALPAVTLRGTLLSFSTAPPAGFSSWTGG